MEAASSAQDLRLRLSRELLWEEYRVGTPQAYHYSQFCQRYRWWKKVLTPVLRMEHKAGEKMFVDSFRPQRSIMTIERRFAPISGRFEPEQVAGLTGIYT